MINRIIDILNADREISGYRVNSARVESYELFFVHKDLETVRSTDTTETKVTVFLEHDGKLGDATFSVYSSYSDEKIKSEIESAKKKAALINNEVYPLPEGEVLTEEVLSNFTDYTPASLASKISEAVFEADKLEGGSINALEIFVYRNTTSVKNSRGIDKTEVKFSAMVEAIPTWNENGESVELYECYNFGEFDAEETTSEIAKRMREVSDRYHAKKPETKLSCPVVLDTPELAQLISELVYELNYAGVYNHSNAFSRGDAIQKVPTGDLLNVTMRGKIKGSTGSAAFDTDGSALTDTTVIKNGTAADYFGSARYASYLGEKITGELRCIEAELGTLSESELKSAPYFRCASMSGLQLDIYNDYIGGEVRLAYYFDGEREIPLTGISISGKLSDCLSGMRLSDTSALYGRYKGPALALFENIEIV